MKTESVRIDSLAVAERNPRRHPEKQIEELVKSIEMFGQYRPLVVDESGSILAGNGLYMALTRLGHDKAVVYRMTGLTEDQKMKLVLADNRTGDLSNDDFDAIEELLSSFEDFDIPGYDPDVLRDLMLSADEALEAAESYGKITDEDRDLFNSRREQADTEADTARQSAGTLPEPPSETSSPDSRGEPSDSVCPTCGRPW